MANNFGFFDDSFAGDFMWTGFSSFSPTSPLGIADRIVVLSVFAIAAAILTCRTAAGSQLPDVGLYPAPRAQCGPICLFIAFRAFGKEADFKKLLRDANTDQRGTTISALESCAIENGLHALSIRTDPHQLSPILKTSNQRLVAVCYVEPSHFVVCYVNDRGAITVADPLKIDAMNDGAVESIEGFTGAVILLSDTPVELQTISSETGRVLTVARVIAGLLILVVGTRIGLRLGGFIFPLALAR